MFGQNVQFIWTNNKCYESLYESKESDRWFNGLASKIEGPSIRGRERRQRLQMSQNS